MIEASKHCKRSKSWLCRFLQKGETHYQYSASERLEIRCEPEDKAPGGPRRVKKTAMVIKDIE